MRLWTIYHPLQSGSLVGLLSGIFMATSIQEQDLNCESLVRIENVLFLNDYVDLRMTNNETKGILLESLTSKLTN
jgi:type III secretory pathway component EscS